MKKKNNVLFLSTIFTCTLPFISLSCKNKKEIELLNPFSDPQRRELIAELVNLYNKENPENYRVVVKQYSDLRKLYLQLSLYLSNKEKNISNLLFHYPSAAHLISKYNRSLNFIDEIKDADLIKQFLQSNEWLSKINNEKGQYILPFASGTESLVVNKLTFGYIMYSFIQFQKKYTNPKNSELENKIKGKNIISSSKNIQKINEFIEYYQSSNKKTKEEINKIWKMLDDDENGIKSKIDPNIFAELNFNFDDSVFKYYQNIFDFSLAVSKLIGNDKINKFDHKEMKHIFYNKGISTLSTLLSFNKANGNYNDYFLNYTKNNTLNYSELFDKTKDSYKKLEDIFEYQSELIKNNALHYFKTEKKKNYVNNYGVFSQFSSRQLAFFKKNDNYKDLDVMQTPTKFNLAQTKETFFDEGVNLIGISKGKIQDRETKKFVYWAYNKKYNWDVKINDKSFNLNLTPTEYFALKLNYAFPSKNFVKQYSEVADELDSKTIRSYVNIIKRISLGEDLRMFHEPFDNKSDTFRSIWEQLLNKNVYEKPRDEMFNFDKIIENLKETIS